MSMLRYLCILLSACLFGNLSRAQTEKIHIVQANTLEYNKYSGTRARKLIGDVIFRHDKAYMYCDSAYFFSDENSMDAYGHVRIEQGDSLSLSGKFMKYNGNTRMAHVRDSVVLNHKNSVLYTDSLNYDRNINMGYYFSKGKILHSDNELVSDLGYYYADEKNYYAVDSVVLINPNYRIYSDTLKYHTESEITYFCAPTRIENDSSILYCEDGWYDTQNDVSAFGRNTQIYNGAQIVLSDSLFYDRNKNFARAFQNTEIHDTSENVIIAGNYGEFSDSLNYAFMTDSALMMYYSGVDTTYVHADTLYIEHDSAGDFRDIYAWWHVQVFKTDMQARADSMVYHERDSLAFLFGEPVLWSEASQATADTISI